MTIFQFILQDSNIDTDLKTIGIIAVGDLCLASGESFYPYFEYSMNILCQAGQMSLEIT
jgi:hypothetical protein